MVDVIIPVYKSGDELIKILKRLLAQSEPVNRIILINTERDFFDEDKYLFDDKIEVHHITKQEFNHGATRNYGMSLSKADYCLFMTMDAVPANKNLISELLGSFKENVAVAYGRQLPKSDCRLMEKYTRAFNYPDTGYIKTKADIERLGIKAFFCSDVCAMYDRSIFYKQGGFEENMIFNEDMVFAAKALYADYGIAYAAGAKVFHSHNYTCMEQLKRNFDLGVSQADYSEIFDSVPSVSEGKKLVINTAKFLCAKGQILQVPYLFVNSFSKYIGYKLGRNYKKLPKEIIMKLTSNTEYWK